MDIPYAIYSQNSRASYSFIYQYCMRYCCKPIPSYVCIVIIIDLFNRPIGYCCNLLTARVTAGRSSQYKCRPDYMVFTQENFEEIISVQFLC